MGERYIFYAVLAKIVLPPLISFVFGYVLPSPFAKKPDPKDQIVLPKE